MELRIAAIGAELLIIGALLLLNGVLAMSELAIVSSRRARLQELAEGGSSGARVALELTESPNRLLSTVQIGITMVGIVAGAFGGATLTTDLSGFLSKVAVLDAYSEPLGFAIVVLSITYLSLVIGELVPKRIALRNPEGVASTVARPMRALSVGAAPLVGVLSISTEAVLRLLGVNAVEEAPVSEEEIRILIEQGRPPASSSPASRSLSRASSGSRTAVRATSPRRACGWSGWTSRILPR